MPNLPETDVLAAIPLDARHVLEIGCGGGKLAHAFRARQPLAVWVGVEREARAAREAKAFMERVIHGDIEDEQTLEALDKARGGQHFDAIVVTDAVSLRDAGRVLAELRGRVAPGGVCVVGVRNMSHWSILQRQSKALADAPKTAGRRFLAGEAAMGLIRRTGWTLLDARPRVGAAALAEAALRELEPLARSAGIDPQRLRSNVLPDAWTFRAIDGPIPPQLHLVGLGLAKFAGVTEARIDYPLEALNSLPRVRAVWAAGGISVPPGFDPGVMIAHRQQMGEPSLVAKVEDLISRGWAIVYDIDDDLTHWPEIGEHHPRNLRSVHAVSVSTDRLAATIRPFNPNVAVFPNGIRELPETVPGTPKQGDRLRIFFGALNRRDDWAAISESLLSASTALADRIEYVVVHDREAFDSIPPAIPKTFHPTLPPDRYMALLASSDIALLPLEDNHFNRCKSDLKFIECCAAGVVPICSPVVYADRPEHRDIGVFAESPADWGPALASLCALPGEIAGRRARGLDYVRTTRMHGQQIAAREAWYRSLLTDRDSLEAARRRRLA